MTKKFFLVVDTETTQSDKVADFGAIICDRQGRIHAQCGVLIREFFLDRENHPLFHSKDADPLWGAANLPRRYAAYDCMLANGNRMLASAPAVNQWLARANAKYKPILTAYNLAFDRSKARNSGIDLDMFAQSFCLWHASADKWAGTKRFAQFVLENHYFGKRTKTGCMTALTNAEVMARFILNCPEMEDEPHTALEDARDYEVPILARLVQTTSPRDYMTPKPYNYRDYQLRDMLQPKTGA